MDKSFLELINELCDKHIDKTKCVYESISIQPVHKKLRAKVFEILLKKKYINECVNELEGNTDSICHLLAWQYTLKNQLHQFEKAKALGIFIEHLKNSEILKDPVLQNVILFLLHLKGTGAKTEEIISQYNILDKVVLKHKSCTDTSALPYDLYQQHRFHFPRSLPPCDQKSLRTFPLNSFKSEPSLTVILAKKPLQKNESVLSYSSDYKFEPLSLQKKVIFQQETKLKTIIYDEGYDSPIKENNQENIWEIVSKLPINEHRTWESLNNIDPVKELPFACESGPKTLHLFQKILNMNVYSFVNDYDNFLQEIIIPNDEFIKSIKYMLVGMTSEIFYTDDSGLFYLQEAITVEGLSSQTLHSYCSDLLFCGSCYRWLYNLCSSNSYKNNEENGYIFKELCESIKRYLAYYRVSALSFSDTANLLTVHSHMRDLRQQIGVLAKICQMPSATKASQPKLIGAQLLDFMYREIMETIDRNVQLVLYAAFYPCCQIYFSRFLQRWLFEGILIDPYEEFIIKAENDYTKSRARVYWTRSFSLRHNAVPEFLSDLKIDILQCGKTMNLLKLCNPDASLYTHIMSRSLPLISCCLTTKQSQKLKQEIDCYYVEMASLCGPRISLYHRLRDRYGNEENAALLSLVEKKRALMFKEMELRKQFEAEEKAKLKRKIYVEMQEQMRLAAEQKKKVKEDELKEELRIAEQNAQIEELRSNLVKEETKMIIKYYNNLIEAVDKRRNSMEIRKQKLLDCTLDLSTETDDSTSDSFESAVSEIFVAEKSVNENRNTEIESKEDLKEVIEPVTKAHLEQINIDTKNLDVQNANIQKLTNLSTEELYNKKNEASLQAQRNRAKILNLEFNTKIIEQTKITSELPIDTSNLTEAQRNKRKVLSSQFDKYYYKQNTKNENNGNMEDNTTVATTSEIKSAFGLTNQENVNNNTNNENNLIIAKVCSDLASPGHEDVMNTIHRKKVLKLPKSNELLTIHEKTNFSNDVIPMSVDSTPNTEFSDLPTELPTPSSAKLTLNTDICLDTPSILDSALLTNNSCITDDGFKFPNNEPKKSLYETTKLLFANKKIFSITENIPKYIRPMRISKAEVEEIKNGNLKSLLYHSVYIPLEAQMKLVNSEIIKCFVNEQNFLSHLHSLRCYYFLFDGEFARHITDNLFSKLYDSKSPPELLSLRSLQLIIEGAIHASSKIQENGDRLSFIVRNIPRSFDLSSAEVFDCLSLSYRINWPLNVILPCDTIEKYDIVFKYLLKLQHMSWVLQKICYELKNTQKEQGIEETLLLASPQYRRIQLYRHVMTHFIQTLQNYTVSEVLQTSWDELESNLKNVTTLDQLYTVHVVYIKTIMFRCLLNRKCESIMKVIREIFVTILKFYNYLRSRSWNLRENDIHYTHPNFKKMEKVFGRFEEFTTFVFRVGNKMARVGYQPHLIQMLDMLNVNEYYTDKQKNVIK